MSTLLEAATLYRDAGLSVIGSRSKNLFPGWKEFQNVKPTDDQLNYFFVQRKFPFLAIICGAGSGNLEVIDVDTKNDTTGTLWDRLFEKITDYYKGQPPFPIVQTPSGGVHIYYRCETIMGNKKLATLAGATKAVIETRGQGGLVLAPPTVGYTFLDDRIPNKIPTITPEERDDILAICIEFNEVTEEPEVVRTKSSSTYKATPWHEYNDSDDWKEVLKEAGWTYTHHNETWEYWRRPGKEEGHSASFNLSSRQFYVFSSSTDFVIQKAYKPFDIYKIIKCGGDVSQSIRDVKAAGYGRMYTPQEEGFIAQAVMQFNSGNLIDDIRDMLAFDFEKAFRDQRDVDMEQLLGAAKSRSLEGQDKFWFEDDNGKLHMEQSALTDFLIRRGYRLLVPDKYAKDRALQLIRILPGTNIIKYIRKEEALKEMHSSIFEVDHNTSIRKLENLIQSAGEVPFSKSLNYLPVIEYDKISFLIKGGDEKTQWFSFKNGAVKVTADNDPEVIPYESLPKHLYLWEQNIKNRAFELSDIEVEAEFNQSVIWRYFKRMVGITPDLEHIDHEELHKTHPDLSARFFSLISVVGSLLSTYKDVDLSVMPIFEEDVVTSAKGGGTGKGLILRIVGFLRQVVHQDCKNWKPSKSFAWDQVTIDTDIIHLEDYEPWYFKISDLNNAITSDLNVEYKYEGTFSMPFDSSPKFALTTNYKVSDDADFESRRQKKVYLTRYFSKQYRPKHEFGKRFGDRKDPSWTDFDWHITDNILIYCLQFFLKNGIIDFVPSENIKRRSIIDTYSQDFFDYIENFLKSNIGKWVLKKELYDSFLTESGKDKKGYTQTKFTAACKAYADKFELQFHVERNKKTSVGELDQYYYIFGEKDKEYPFEAKFIKGEFF